jgi:hypothetical protein
MISWTKNKIHHAFSNKAIHLQNLLQENYAIHLSAGAGAGTWTTCFSNTGATK